MLYEQFVNGDDAAALPIRVVCKTIELGDIPPRIEGIKVYPFGEEVSKETPEDTTKTKTSNMNGNGTEQGNGTRRTSISSQHTRRNSTSTTNHKRQNSTSINHSRTNSTSFTETKDHFSDSDEETPSVPTTNATSLMIDVHFTWTGQCKFIVSVGLKARTSVKTDVAFEELHVAGSLRIILTPLTNTLPPFNTIQISWIAKPTVQFRLGVGKTSITSVPGVLNLLEKKILQELFGMYAVDARDTAQ